MAVQVRNNENVALSPKEFNALCGTQLSWGDLYWFDWSQCMVSYSDLYDEEFYKKRIKHGNERKFPTFCQAANQYMMRRIRCYDNYDITTYAKSVALAEHMLLQIKKLYDNGLHIVSLNIG